MIKVRCAGGCGDVCYDETAIEVAWPEPWRCDPCEARHEADGDALRAERDALAATVQLLRLRIAALQRVVEAASEICLRYAHSEEERAEVAYIHGSGALESALLDLDALEGT